LLNKKNYLSNPRLEGFLFGLLWLNPDFGLLSLPAEGRSLLPPFFEKPPLEEEVLDFHAFIKKKRVSGTWPNRVFTNQTLSCLFVL